MVDPGDVAHVLDVSDDLVDRGAGLGMLLAVCRGERVERDVVFGVDPGLERCHRGVLAPQGGGGGDELGHERHHADAVVVAQGLEHVVGDVAGRVADGARG